MGHWSKEDACVVGAKEVDVINRPLTVIAKS